MLLRSGRLVIVSTLLVVSCQALGQVADQDAKSNNTSEAAADKAGGDSGGLPGFDLGSVEEDIRVAIEDGEFPSAAFAIVQHGEILHEGAIGWVDSEKKIASTAHTPYPLASVSKPIVATAALILQERGQLKLDQTAAHYIGDWMGVETPHPDYTLEQLLSHTAGLGTYARIYWDDQETPVRCLEQSFAKYAFLAQPPGTVSEYSNLGYGLVGEIVERQSGTGLGGFLDEALFQPLGMHNTMMIDSFAEPDGAARKHDANGNAIAATYNDTPGAGNIYASAHDLALFGAFHLDDKSDDILSREGRRLMRSHEEPEAIYPYYGSARYGLGWYFRQHLDNEVIVWHEGGMPGASSIIVLLPDRGVVATVLINATDANAHAQKIANALIARVEPDFQPATFNPIEGFGQYSDQSTFLGRWEGAITVDGRDMPWSLEFEDDGTVHAEFPDRQGDDLLPSKTSFSALVNGDVLVATFAARLPASDVEQSSDGYVLLRLVRRGDELSGAAVAYATPQRLEHLYPFATRLQRASQAGLPKDSSR